MKRYDYDIVIISDFRFPGGTSTAVAEEIKVQASAGYSTALIQAPSPSILTEKAFSKSIVHLIQSGAVDLLPNDRAVTARLLQIRHPSVLQRLPAHPPRVEADLKIVVVNSAPFNRDRSKVYYNLYEARNGVTKLFGPECLWAPLSPFVREALISSGWKLNLTQEDWHEVIAVDEWRADRSHFAASRPVIGRHSRPGPEKWPKSPEEILAAYPEDERFIVKILGGAEVPTEILGRVPSNWVVREFEEISPAMFLRGIDFYVYFHHPNLIEAFGRSILEALASGVPSIVPHHFRPLFEDSCIYARPDEVKGIVARLYADRNAYLAQSERGVRFVRERFGWEQRVKKLEGLIGRSSAAPRRIRLAPAPDKSNVLLIASNGVGMGHLNRLLAIARRLPQPMRPVILSMSQAMQPILDHGFLAEFFPARDYMISTIYPLQKKVSKLKRRWWAAKWNQLLAARINEVLKTYDPVAVIFDGASVYNGLREAMAKDPGRPYIWSRRAMWRAGLGYESLSYSNRFSGIIEPGELAENADVGATVSRRHEATCVGPVLLLDESELLNADEARQTLGLDPGRPAVLVQLGAGNIGDVATPTSIFIRLLARTPDIQIVVTEPIIANQAMQVPQQVKKVTIYPLSKYYRAFDFVVSASGYNSYHELIGFGIPTIFVPNLDTLLDDQAARARYAHEAGVALCVEEPTEQSAAQALKVMGDKDKRAAMSARCREVFRGNGAQAAADAVRDVVNKSRIRQAPRPAAQRTASQQPSPQRKGKSVGWQAFFDRWHLRMGELRGYLMIRAKRMVWAYRLFMYGPKGPKRRDDKMPVLIIACGLSDSELETAVERIHDLDVMFREFRPIFVTDSCSFNGFRRYRYYFEYIPPKEVWDEHNPAASWAEYRDRRIKSIIDTHMPERMIALDDRTGLDALRAGMFNALIQPRTD